MDRSSIQITPHSKDREKSLGNKRERDREREREREQKIRRNKTCFDRIDDDEPRHVFCIAGPAFNWCELANRPLVLLTTMLHHARGPVGCR